MRISFDLDDTLICYNPNVPCEANRVPFFLRSWFEEPLRLGAVELMKELKRQGHSLWIYTTSYRSPKQVKRWFKFYGVEVDGVINQELHERLVGRDRFEKYVSKYPPAFDIDLHVDDLEGVQLEGEERGFKVVVVSMADETWAQRVCWRQSSRRRRNNSAEQGPRIPYTFAPSFLTSPLEYSAWHQEPEDTVLP